MRHRMYQTIIVYSDMPQAETDQYWVLGHYVMGLDKEFKDYQSYYNS